MNWSSFLARWRPSVADVLFLLIALVVFRGVQHTLLDDPGLGWHLRNIDAMIEQGGWLTHDPFTDPRGEAPPRWYSNQWLGELAYYLGWRWAGLEGIGMVNAVILATLAGVLYRILLADGLAWPVAAVWTSIGMMGTSCSWNARPNVFTLLFTLLTARACVLLHESRLTRLQVLGLIALFAIWANTHGGFLAGLILLVVTVGVELGTLSFERAMRVGAITMTAAGATLLNPYGIDLYRWTFQLLGDPFFMGLHQEWRSPDFNSGGAMRYELLILLFPLLLGLTSRKPNLVELALAVVWLHFALTGFRYVALWVVVTVPLLARCSVEIESLNAWFAHCGLNREPGSLFYTPPDRPAWRVSLLLAGTLLLLAKPLEGHFAVHKQAIIASEAIDRLIALADEWNVEHGRRPVICHDYDWGGYLTWKGWPRLLNWIDDRNEVQGERRIREYRSLMRAEPGWREQLKAVDFICIKPDTLLRARLDDDPRWRKLESLPHAVIYLRQPENR